jgi:hypothetical protein
MFTGASSNGAAARAVRVTAPKVRAPGALIAREIKWLHVVLST